MHEIREQNHITIVGYQLSSRKIDMLFQRKLAWCSGVIHSRRAKFFKAVHILFTLTAFRPASGLRLETGGNIDKKKSEFYFLL